MFLILLFQSNSTWRCFGIWTWQGKFGNHFMKNNKSYFFRHNSPSNPKCSWSMLWSSLNPGHFFHIVPIFSPMLETIWCMRCKSQKILIYTNTFVKHVYIWLKCYYLELLVGEAAVWTAGALDPDIRCSFWTAHLQERSEHAPPENTASQHSTHFLT